MASGGAGILEGRAELLRTALPQVFELMPDQESHEVRQAEARDYPGCAVSRSRRVLEGGVEFSA